MIPWYRFARTYKRRLRLAVAAAAIYPLLVITAVVTLAFFVAPLYEASDAVTSVRAIILHDGAILLLILAAIGVAGFPVWSRRRQRARWYAAFAAVHHRLEKGDTFSTAIHTVPFLANGTVPRLLETGESPAAACSLSGCPRPLVQVLSGATGRDDLIVRLDRSITDFQEESLRHLARLEHALPSLLVSCAGAVAIWVVVRIIVPALEARYVPSILG